MDLSNWRTAPYNHEAFHNVEKLLSTQVVRKAETVSTLESKPVDFSGFKVQQHDLSSFEAATETDGLVVLHNGKIVYEKYFQGNMASSKHIMFSLTKSITGLLAGILSSQGKLDMTAPIKTYVPSASSIWDNVTVQQCLDMNSGIAFPDDNNDYRSSAGWNVPSHDNDSSKPRTLRSFLSRVQAHTDGPGAGFNYASVNIDLVGIAIEEVTGQKFADVVSDLLWKPMGAEGDALMTVDSQGTARAAGGLCATVGDLAGVGQLVAEGGRGVVPAAWFDDMLRNGDRAGFAKGSWAAGFKDDYEGMAYRSGWLVCGEEEVLIGLGIHGQQLMVDRRNGVVMAKTSSGGTAVDFGQIKMQVSGFKEFSRILLKK